MTTLDSAALLARMPKAEVHLHLEGTMPPETLWSLAQQHGVQLQADSLEGLRALYRFQGFGTFLTLWLSMHACFRDAMAYAQMVDAYVDACRAQNIRYVGACAPKVDTSSRY